MATKTTTKPKKPATITVRLGTAINGSDVFQKLVDSKWVEATAATQGDVVTLGAAHANRMIAKGRAEKVSK